MADCGDPFMLSQNRVYNKPFYFKFFEKRFCKNADTIAVPIEGAIESYYPEFRDKMKVIPQGFRFDELNNGTEKIKNKVPTFAYAGTLVPKRRDPGPLIEYLLSKGVPFQFHVYTDNAGMIKPYSDKFPDKVIFHGFKDRNNLLHDLKKVDFVLNYENVGNSQLPSKLIDYAIIGKPILSIHFKNFDKRVVDEFIDGEYCNQKQIDNIEQYRIDNVANQFVDLLNK